MAALRRASREAAPVRLLWFDGNDELEGFLHTVDVPFRHLVQTGDESYLSGLVAGKVDALATYDISQTSLADDAHDAGVAILSTGSMPGALLVMGSHPFASHTDLQRSDLRGAKVLIPGRGVYDHWSRCLAHLLGEDLELQPCLVPVDREPLEPQVPRLWRRGVLHVAPVHREHRPAAPRRARVHRARRRANRHSPRRSSTSPTTPTPTSGC